MTSGRPLNYTILTDVTSAFFMSRSVFGDIREDAQC